MSTTTPLELWDADWCRWYDLAVRRGKTPNEAIPVAYRQTEDQHGPRPDEAEAVVSR